MELRKKALESETKLIYLMKSGIEWVNERTQNIYNDQGERSDHLYTYEHQCFIHYV